MMRMPSMAHTLPPLSCVARERAFVFEAEFSTAGTAGGRLGTLGGLCIVAPYETYERAAAFISLLLTLCQTIGCMNFPGAEMKVKANRNVITRTITPRRNSSNRGVAGKN